MLALEDYQKYWKKAKERTSCYPGELSFVMLTAAAQDMLTAEFECMMTRILVFASLTSAGGRSA